MSITGRELKNNTTDTIPAAQFVGPACVIDVTADAAANEDYLLDVASLERWETKHGRVPKGAWVLLRTGWSRRSGKAFLNVRDDGPHGPGFDQATSQMRCPRTRRQKYLRTAGTLHLSTSFRDARFP